MSRKYKPFWNKDWVTEQNQSALSGEIPIMIHMWRVYVFSDSRILPFTATEMGMLFNNFNCL